MLIAIHFAVGRIELRVYVLREEQRAMPAYEEPPVLPGGSFLLNVQTGFYTVVRKIPAFQAVPYGFPVPQCGHPASQESNQPPESWKAGAPQ